MQTLLGGNAANGGVGGVFRLISGVLGLATGSATPPRVLPTTLNLTLDPSDPAPGSTAVLTVRVSGHDGPRPYGIAGVPVRLALFAQPPGLDARLSATSLTTDGSGAAATVLTLSETRGRHVVRAATPSLYTEFVVDTRTVAGSNTPLTLAGFNPAALFVGAILVLLIGLLARLVPPPQVHPGLVLGWRRFDRRHPGRWSLGPLFAIAAATAFAGAVVLGHVPVLIGVGALGACMVLGLTAWRPVIGCIVLALALPLTAGMGNSPILPMIGPSAALSAIVAIGMLAHFLPKRRKVGFTTLDVAVAAFTIGGALVPWAVLFLSKLSVGVATWQSVLAPLQYLLVYALFSRLEVTTDNMRRILQLEMLASILIGIVGLVQLADLPGVREFIANAYPIGGQLSTCRLGACRPTSLLDHWSAFGAFGVFNYALALALVCTPATRLSNRWLTVVMAVNVAAVLASQSPVASIGLVLVTVVVLVHRGRMPRRLVELVQRGRVPRQVPVAAVALAIAAGVFWTQTGARAEPQAAAVRAYNAGSAGLPKRDPNQALVPLIQEHFWTGTGTVVPTQVSDRLTGYVDSEYLQMGLRGGILGEVLLLLMLAAVAVVGWRSRGSPRPLIQALGAIMLTSAIVVAVLGTSADYLSYAGVSQLFWMIVGLVAGSLLPAVAANWPSRQSVPGVSIRSSS